MTLQTSNRLAAYEVLSLIGEDGMGQVYRARDTKLNRDVVLKVLPEAFALDPDRLARFKREAQVLASLNHPNIAAIYGFEDSSSVHALVLGFGRGTDAGGAPGWLRAPGSGVLRQNRRGTLPMPRERMPRRTTFLKRRGSPCTASPRRHVDKTSTSSRRSTEPVRLRGVRSDEVIRQLPGTRPLALPSASERVVSSARPSPKRDVFATHDSRGDRQSGDVANAVRRGRSRGPDTPAG